MAWMRGGSWAPPYLFEIDLRGLIRDPWVRPALCGTGLCNGENSGEWN